MRHPHRSAARQPASSSHHPSAHQPAPQSHQTAHACQPTPQPHQTAHACPIPSATSSATSLALDLTHLGPYQLTEKSGDKLYRIPGGKVFLVQRPHTLELRTDSRLGQLLRQKYESVMDSRYFGRGGIEIVPSGQLTSAELHDLIRLSYDLTARQDQT